jgi:hypothetical protein
MRPRKRNIASLFSRLGREDGFSIVEMAVSAVIATIFMLTAGTAYIVNQKSYKANDEKRELQQNVAHIMEMMERQIRGSARAVIPSPPNNNRVELLDTQDQVITRFRLNTVSGIDRIFQDNALLARQKLITLTFVPNHDTSTVTINLNLEDENFNKVAMKSSATLRNHIRMRNVFDPN